MSQRRKTRADRLTRIGIGSHPLGDLYHFLLTTSWLTIFGLIVALYAGANALFALTYYLDDGGVENVRTYWDAYFFSVQTMATIGYGKMVPESGFANAVVSFEALFGLVGLAMATGLMFAKFSRPTARVVFSRPLCLSKRDGVLSLMFRVANERAAGLAEATMRLIFAFDDVTPEGEQVRRFVSLDLARSQTALFALSWTVIHPITDKSPLFGATPASLAARGVEIIASIVGLDGATNETVHARYTWEAKEILFDKRLVDVLLPQGDGRVVFDYRRFHDVRDA